MTYTITLLPGDGIGPEVTEATRRVLEATGVSFNWEQHLVGTSAMEEYDSPLPESVVKSIRKNKVAIKGPVTTPVGSGFRSVNVALRKELELYACLRPCKTYPGVPSRYKDIDLVIVRENIEDLYSGIEYEKSSESTRLLIEYIARTKGDTILQDSGISIKPISDTRSRRIVTFAFEYARKYARKKVTAVHKANIMKFSDGLFLAVARDVAKNYPDIEFEDRIVDNMSMQLVQKPHQFDVIVAPNLYGDILSDLCAGLIGGLGLAPGANLSDDIALFEATHGSAPKYTGMNKVNPLAMMLSGVLMLRHLGESDSADRLEKAIADVVAEGRYVTYDLKPEDPASAAGTSEVADAVINRLASE
ncbi:MAG: isocitrate/isopropylmalate dehydrogenase family protein [Dehalococcoidales bacterium]|nr:isocitrate/isopropylmalate dehydrogenase family protein [Dehalococcoidales bacterium]